MDVPLLLTEKHLHSLDLRQERNLCLLLKRAATPTPETDFCEPYVRALLRFIGIEEMECVKVPNQFMPSDIRSLSIEGAKAKLLELAKTW